LEIKEKMLFFFDEQVIKTAICRLTDGQADPQETDGLPQR